MVVPSDSYCDIVVEGLDRCLDNRVRERGEGELVSPLSELTRCHVSMRILDAVNKTRELQIRYWTRENAAEECTYPRALTACSGEGNDV